MKTQKVGRSCVAATNFKLEGEIIDKRPKKKRASDQQRYENFLKSEYRDAFSFKEYLRYKLYKPFI